jgi:hypothetical protein
MIRQSLSRSRRHSNRRSPRGAVTRARVSSYSPDEVCTKLLPSWRRSEASEIRNRPSSNRLLPTGLVRETAAKPTKRKLDLYLSTSFRFS